MCRRKCGQCGRHIGGHSQATDGSECLAAGKYFVILLGHLFYPSVSVLAHLGSHLETRLANARLQLAELDCQCFVMFKTRRLACICCSFRGPNRRFRCLFEYASILVRPRLGGSAIAGSYNDGQQCSVTWCRVSGRLSDRGGH